jgi:cytochrome c553
MKKTLDFIFTIASMTLIALSAQAGTLVDGSAEAGKDKAVTCTACHGPEGNSVNPLWPNIAGQGAPYLLAQLQAFKAGTRSDPLMTSQAMMLSDQDMADLAAYFESLPGAAQAVADPALVDKAEALYRGGDVSDQVSACIACHGPTGRGNPAANYPAVAGQHSAYAAKQLRDYASGARKSDGKTRMMRDIAAKLGEDDIVALASYIQGLR